jgi:hypothetical protein
VYQPYQQVQPVSQQVLPALADHKQACVVMGISDDALSGLRYVQYEVLLLQLALLLQYCKLTVFFLCTTRLFTLHACIQCAVTAASIMVECMQRAMYCKSSACGSQISYQLCCAASGDV